MTRMFQTVTVALFVGSLAACMNASRESTASSEYSDWTAHLTGTEEPPVYVLPEGDGTPGASSRPVPKCTSDKKELICHIPPGNPANWHTICVSVNAVETHVSHHGDLVGACAADVADAGTGGEDPGGEADAGSEPEAPACTPFNGDCSSVGCCAGLRCTEAYVCDYDVE